jgi:hypothetical protein
LKNWSVASNFSASAPINRPLRKLASGSMAEGTHGTEDRSISNIHEVSRTGALRQPAAEVEFPERSNIGLRCSQLLLLPVSQILCRLYLFTNFSFTRSIPTCFFFKCLNLKPRFKPRMTIDDLPFLLLSTKNTTRGGH